MINTLVIQQYDDDKIFFYEWYSWKLCIVAKILQFLALVKYKNFHEGNILHKTFFDFRKKL